MAEALSERGYVPRLQLAFVTLEIEHAPEVKEESEIRRSGNRSECGGLSWYDRPLDWRSSV
ncbi:hypothetical protein [Fontibacillus sp. BL9]|uniref:hypothetical protein n=1 Tax=Fontibacillus sp. BL9 TaxID=3389971 RepID=UPI0039788B07